jgi:glutamate dehydrogenase
VAAGLERWLAPHERAALDTDVAQRVAQGVPQALAQRVARLDALFSALDIVEVGSETGSGVEAVAGVYFGVGGRLDLGWLSQQIATLRADSHWQGLAKVALRDDLSALARGLARSVLQGAGAGSDAQAAIDAWEAQRGFRLWRCNALLAELKPVEALDMAMLSVLLRELRALV